MTQSPANDRVAYTQLLEAALGDCDQVKLVVRGDMALHAGGRSVLESLAPFKVAQEEVREWPGTRLGSGVAKLLTYQLGAAVVNILGSAAEVLFDWQQPKLPEDPSFWRRGKPWFYCVSHEQECHFEIPPSEVNRLLAKFPRLSPLISPGTMPLNT